MPIIITSVLIFFIYTRTLHITILIITYLFLYSIIFRNPYTVLENNITVHCIVIILFMEWDWSSLICIMFPWLFIKFTVVLILKYSPPTIYCEVCSSKTSHTQSKNISFCDTHSHIGRRPHWMKYVMFDLFSWPVFKSGTVVAAADPFSDSIQYTIIYFIPMLKQHTFSRHLSMVWQWS